MKNDLEIFRQLDENYIPDHIFECDNGLEVPALQIGLQANIVEAPFVCFGEQRRTYSMNGSGTLHFYTEDYRFNAVYEHPEKIMQHHPRNIIEPNFSLFQNTPVAYGFAQLYKKRWIARAMQERGIGVFVDLNVAPKFYQLNLLGVPKGWGSFATRGYSDRLNVLEYEYEIAKFVAGGNKLIFVVYGGGEICRGFCQQHKCVYITPVIAIKNKIKAMKEIKDSIFQIENLYKEQAIKALFEKQVLDYSLKLTE